MDANLLAFGLAFILSVLFVPAVRWASLRYGGVTQPREDRWNKRPVPSLGGIGIFLAFSGSLLATAGFLIGWDEIPWGMLAGSLLMFGLGLYDDLVHMTPPAKLVGQILAATLVIFQGYTTNFFTPRLANHILAQIPNILLTYLWLVGISNAINLLDNMDGLAAGIALVAAGFLGYFAWTSGNSGLLIISLTLAGSVLGFLVFNFPPASIFMGDSGSLFLGFTLAVVAIARQPRASNIFAVMGVPTLMFLLPILDTTFVTITRLLRGQSPAQGGRDHTSHRLIAFGLSERQAVLTLYTVAVITGVVGILIERLQYWLSLVLVPILVVSLALLTAYLGGLKVVTAPDQKPRGTITRLMLELTYKRRLLEILLDFFLIGIAYYLAFFTRYGLSMNDDTWNLYLATLPVAYGGAYLSFFLFGVYRGVWRYVGVGDLLNYLKAALGSVALAAGAIFLLPGFPDYSSLLPVLFGVYLFIGLAASRSSFKILDQAYARQVHAQEQRILICGAGDAGEMAVRWISMNPQLGYRPVGFLDDDPFKAGRVIHGVEILGRLDQLDDVIKSKQVDGVIIAMQMDMKLQELIENCRSQGRWVRTLRLDFELVE
jgi:UDP-GlcNAc:undecaprenyl-phosphate GlcNAc-1-phosphate transferase